METQYRAEERVAESTRKPSRARDTRTPDGGPQRTPEPERTPAIPSTAAIAGHPIHPMLIPLPLSFLVGAFGADIGFWWTNDPFWARAALWLTGAGVVLGLLAAIPGIIDFSTKERIREHQSAWFHGIGNVVVIVLAAISWWLRLGDSAAAILPWGITLSAIITLLLVITGWLGGELSYRHKIGVMREADH